MLLTLRVQRMLHQMRHALAAPSRNARTAVVVGRLLAIAFIVCFGTGLYSHFLQEPLPWMVFPTRPLWLYQVTQGTHIIAGIACFPLIFAKLYAVFPELFKTPAIRSFPHFLERASIAVFVAASLVEITIGLLNTYQFYSLFPFSFRRTHYMLAFVIIGSLAIHIGVKLPIIAQHWRKNTEPPEENDPDAEFDVPDELRRRTGQPQSAGLTGRLFGWIDRKPAPRGDDVHVRTSRRAFNVTLGVATATVVGLTAGQSFSVANPINVFGPRKNGVGPQGLPVNKTAASADVVELASDPAWTLTIVNGTETATFDYAALRALPQYEEVLPLACVEGWSQYATWKGPRLSDLLDTVGAPTSANVRIRSLQTNSSFGTTEMQPEFCRDPLTLVALEVDGQTLDLDHGYPARIIAPARPGVLQTKWLSQVEVIDA